MDEQGNSMDVQRPTEESIEPTMMLHRPSSARSQDVRHILTRTFGDLFTRDAISVDTIKNLITSRGGDDEYHESYVDRLQQVLVETESKLSEITKLERHIMQAEAKALSTDERQMKKAIVENHSDLLGLPIDSNHYRSCIDCELLKKHNLLTPDRYANYEPAKLTKPHSPAEPNYTKATESFQMSTKQKKERKEKLRQSRFPQSGEKGKVKVSDSKISQLNGTLDDEDKESIDYIIDGSEAGDELQEIATPNKREAKRKRDKRDSKKVWTEQPSVEQREKEREALKNIQDRTNYLKNPRFDPSQAKLLVSYGKAAPKEINIKQPVDRGGSIDKVQVFLAIPAVVTFTDYQVGQVYEATLELKNISSSLRPVRVLPTSSSFFSIGLGQFPGEEGLVASGMSAHFKIRFMPDSLGEYTDEIHVQSQCAAPLIVKVIAKRPAPVLTIPPVVDVGDCLVGGSKTVRFLVRNDGGDGKFCFLPKEKWPVTNFKSSVNPSMLEVPPFQIRPSIFELKHQEVTMLELIFHPSTLGYSSEEVLLLSDNCHMKKFTFTGQGQKAAVEFVAVDGGTSEKLPGELCDFSAQKLLRFEDLNPFTYTQKTLILSNTTNVALPFEWIVVKPHIVSPSEEDESHPPVARTIDAESVFSIDPQNGILEPSGIANFKITFAPPEVNKFHSILHLVLPGIPQTDKSLEELNKSGRFASAMKDVTTFELECKSECVPLKVLLKPYAIYINGKTLIGTTVRRQFTFINNSLSPVTFQWETSSSGNILEVTPALGEVGPYSSSDMEISVTGCSVGKMHEILWCHVKHLDEPVALHVDFEVKGPEVYIDEPDFNFGLVRFGTSVSTHLTLHNDSQMPASFNIKEKLPANQDESKSEFIFSPPQGELKPLETKAINIDFYPQSCRQVRTYFELTVGDGGLPRMVAVRADIQNPDVCLLSSNLNISRLFVSMPMTQTITLINKSMLRTQYHWGEPIGSQASLCSIDIVKTGDLGPKEHAEIEITFTSKEQIDINDVILLCHVAGMEEPLLLSITAKVEGLQVAYAIQDSADLVNFDEATANSTEIDFGTVAVHRTAKKYFYMRNKTSIPTEYRIHLEHFNARPPTPPPSSSGKKSLLQRTPNIADPTSKSKDRAEIELKQQLLKTNKGLALVPTPAEGKLAPYQELVVELTLYNDMWGEYRDSLICHVGDLEPFTIPVKANISGIPLHFHMAAVNNDPTLSGCLPNYLGAESVKSFLKFGTHAANAKAITRKVTISNHSPVDVQIDWQMYNVLPNDEQIVDLVVTFGDAFPKKDASGNAVSKSITSSDSAIYRPPTDMIPDSIGSTPTASQLALASSSEYANDLSRNTANDLSSNTEHDKGDVSDATGDGNNDGDDPLVTVTLRVHEGHEANKPFTVSPGQMVVPARDKRLITVTFNPESGNPMGEVCDSYILGYLNLEHKDVSCNDRVIRPVGYSMLPMKLNLSGCIEPALLTNEYMDDEGLRFRGVASDLMRDGVQKPKTYYCVSNGTKVTNLTEALLTFKIDIPHPFIFSKSVPSVGEDNCISLKPNQSSEIYVDFCMTPDQLDFVRTLKERSEEDIGKKKIVVINYNGERQIHFTDKLRIHFTSGAVQELPLHGSIVLPSLAVNKVVIDFGTCLIGQPIQKTFTLKNHTRSGSYWYSKRTKASPKCRPDSFAMYPDSGSLDAHIAHITNSSRLVTLTFVAHDEGCYEAEYTIRGILAEEPVSILAKGVGSYDEKYHDELNLIINP